MDNSDLDSHLREHGVMPTPQRLRIARIILVKHAHMSAEEIYRNVNGPWPPVSRATVYNTLGLFVEKGLLREVIVDPNKVYYDSNVESHHHHFYDEETGELTDISEDEITVENIPDPPDGKSVDKVDVVVKLKQSVDSD